MGLGVKRLGSRKIVWLTSQLSLLQAATGVKDLVPPCRYMLRSAALRASWGRSTTGFCMEYYYDFMLNYHFVSGGGVLMNSDSKNNLVKGA